jgi:putative cardiolipin synthase
MVSNIKSIYARHKTEHNITLLKQGLSSLNKRINLIRNAKKSIEMEFFIYELDTSSRLITHELIKAAERGVKVRVLVDYSITVFKLGPEYTKYLNEKNIEVRYYNTISNSNFIAVQHRNHRKLLIIDEKSVVTGGRNIANEYFDLSPDYNFLDYDILVKGEITKDIRDSFFSYWDSDYASTPNFEDNVIHEDFFNDKNTFNKVLAHLEKNQDKFKAFEKEYQCNDISYVTDFPGVLVSNRQVYKRIEKIVNESKESIVVESPYLVLREDGLTLIKKTVDRNVQFSILTNGLSTTDAYYTSSALALKLGEIKETGLGLAFYRGGTVYNDYSPFHDKVSDWGLHSKRAVIDKKHTIVGTYNIDPRSANLNSEMIIICRNNKVLADAVLADINLRKEKSDKLDKNSFKVSSVTKNAQFESKMKFFLSIPVVYFLEFLL